MRALTLLVTPPEESYPTSGTLAAEAAFNRERIYHLNVLDDGTIVMLGRLGGNLADARRAIEAGSNVLEYTISEDGDEDSGGLVYVHLQPPPSVERFLRLPRRHEVFFDFPIKGTPDGRFRVVMIGETDDVLQEALTDIPEDIAVDVERIGAYPETDDIAALVTDRQREVLRTAVKAGYYEVPRQATHADIARRMDLSTATVGEHLQKIEARVFGALVG